jgi:hypothetical protein
MYTIQLVHVNTETETERPEYIAKQLISPQNLPQI